MLTALALLLAAPTVPAPPQVRFVPVGRNLMPRALSADGAVTAGATINPLQGAIYSLADGLLPITPPASGFLPGILVVGISDDATRVHLTAEGGTFRGGFEWTAAAGLVPLPPYNGPASFYDLPYARAASRDGRVVFAQAYDGDFIGVYETLRYVDLGPATSLCGTYPPPCGFNIVAASGDGSRAVLTQLDMSAPDVGVWRWTAGGTLEPIRRGFNVYMNGCAMTADGETVFGTLPDRSAFRWTQQTGLQPIGAPSTASTFPLFTSGDGTLVAAGGDTPALWDDVNGWRLLDDVLVANGASGLTLPPHRVRRIRAVSSDGGSLVCEIDGYPSVFPGQPAAFIVHLDGRGPGTVGLNSCGPAAPNSRRTPGTLRATGTARLADNDLTLVAEWLPANQFGIVVNSRALQFVPAAGGNAGSLCLGGQGATIGRHDRPSDIRSSGPDGRFTYDVDLTRLPAGNVPVSAMVGETWSFQAWYRDSVGGQATANFTDAVSVLVE